jgi:hypothetical protein
MLNRAEQRNRQHPEGKDTIFIFGEQVWTTERIQKSFRRANFAEGEVVPLGI